MSGGPQDSAALSGLLPLPVTRGHRQAAELPLKCSYLLVPPAASAPEKWGLVAVLLWLCPPGCAEFGVLVHPQLSNRSKKPS